MEFEFDKEIDAILRKARENEAVFAAKISEPHLEADTLSAFAENALPEKSKKLYTAHLADCDRCRRILSNLISLNAEEEIVPVKSTETPIVETAIPWYRKLLFGRNLVYTMGALVAVFSAFTIYIVFQNMSGSLSSEVSQANTSTKARGPSAVEEPFSSNAASATNTATMSNTNSASTNSAMTTANTSTSAMNTSATPPMSANSAAQPLAKSPETADKSRLDDAIISSGETAPEAFVQATPPPKEESRDAKNESEATKPNLGLARPKNDIREERKASPAPPPPVEAEKDDRQDKAITRSAPKSSVSGTAQPAKRKAPTKNVGGKTFNYENSVWVDSQYRQGNPIINVSRGTNEYRKLDGGLRNIAEQFNETVVVVWKSKNYRIQ